MPEKSHARRAQQIGTLSKLAHIKSTDPGLKKLVDELMAALPSDAKHASNVKHTARDLKRKTLFDASFVEEMSRATSEAFFHWQEAKKKNDYSLYAPFLQALQPRQTMGFRD
jgi:carboxypeptidase Taq